VVYALQKSGEVRRQHQEGRPRHQLAVQHLQVPRTPARANCLAGQASLAAALNPADAPFLYFVSKNDGSHVFATTLAEHNRNVQEYSGQILSKRRSVQ
jgi:UPF0755 protein